MVCHGSLSSRQSREETFQDAHDETRSNCQTFLHKVPDHECYVFLHHGWQPPVYAVDLLQGCGLRCWRLPEPLVCVGLLTGWKVSRLRAAHGCCVKEGLRRCSGRHAAPTTRMWPPIVYQFRCSGHCLYKKIVIGGAWIRSGNCNGKLADARNYLSLARLLCLRNIGVEESVLKTFIEGLTLPLRRHHEAATYHTYWKLCG